jgi:hypothetical protein
VRTLAAKTLEARLDTALDHIWIGAKLMKDGQDTAEPRRRLQFISEHLTEAFELQAKIEKRDKRKAVA